MRLLVVNPHTTASMTEKIGAAARRAASPGSAVTAVNPRTGPVSIEGYYDEAISVPGLLDVVRANPDADAVIVGSALVSAVENGLGAVRSLTEELAEGVRSATVAS